MARLGMRAVGPSCSAYAPVGAARKRARPGGGARRRVGRRSQPSTLRLPELAERMEFPGAGGRRSSQAERRGIVGGRSVPWHAGCPFGEFATAARTGRSSTIRKPYLVAGISRKLHQDFNLVTVWFETGFIGLGFIKLSFGLVGTE